MSPSSTRGEQDAPFSQSVCHQAPNAAWYLITEMGDVARVRWADAPAWIQLENWKALHPEPCSTELTTLSKTPALALARTTSKS